MKNGATWHWCSNCPQFPKNDVETVEVLPRDARRCRTCLDLAKSGGCKPAEMTATPQTAGVSVDVSQDYRPAVATRTTAATAQRKFLTYEQRVLLEAELRATNWLPAEEAKIVKEDILIKHETIFATQGFFPKDIAELRLMVEHGII
jgi:hypothetical protein